MMTDPRDDEIADLRRQLHHAYHTIDGQQVGLILGFVAGMLVMRIVQALL